MPEFIDTDNKALTELYKSITPFLVGEHNKNNPKHQISPEEKDILSKKPELAEAIFNSGIKDLIAAGKTTVTQLESQPPELLNILRNGRVEGAVKDNTISVDQLSKISAADLQKANDLIHGNIDKSDKKGKENFAKVVELLKLDEKQADALQKSFAKTDEEFRKNFQPAVDNELPPAQNTPPKQHNTPELKRGAAIV